MARPRKAVEYLVQRIADLFRYGDREQKGTQRLDVFSAPPCHALTYHIS